MRTTNMKRLNFINVLYSFSNSQASFCISLRIWGYTYNNLIHIDLCEETGDHNVIDVKQNKYILISPISKYNKYFNNVIKQNEITYILHEIWVTSHSYCRVFSGSIWDNRRVCHVSSKLVENIMQKQLCLLNPQVKPTTYLVYNYIL